MLIIVSCMHNVLSQNSTTLADIESFKIGDTCVVKTLNTREIAGVLVQRNSNTIHLVDKNVNYTIAIDDIISIKYLHKTGQEISKEGDESQTPSYDYRIHLKDRSIVHCDPVALTGDTLMTNIKKSGNKNLYADDINTVIKINKSCSVQLGFIGGFAGLGLGYLISHAIAYSDYREPVPGSFNFDIFSGMRETGVVCGTILGVVTGAVIGAIIGSSFGNDDIYTLDKMDKQQKIREIRRIIEEK